MLAVKIYVLQFNLAWYQLCDLPWYAGIPTDATGDTTDEQPTMISIAVQIIVLILAIVGWITVLVIVLAVIVLCYRHKKRKKQYRV